MPDHSCCVLLYTELHSVLFVQYVFIRTEQAETYPKNYVSIHHSTYRVSQLAAGSPNAQFGKTQFFWDTLYICASLFGWKEKFIFEATLNSKL